jgi:hypothetical protein
MLDVRRSSKHDAIRIEKRVVCQSKVCGLSGQPLYRRWPGRKRTRAAESLGNTGHNRHKHYKRRLFDCEQFSRYGHEHGVLIFVIGNSFLKSERVGKPDVAFPLAV